MDDEIQRALDKELQKPPRIHSQVIPWRVVILVLIASIAGFVAVAVATL